MLPLILLSSLLPGTILAQEAISQAAPVDAVPIAPAAASSGAVSSGAVPTAAAPSGAVPSGAVPSGGSGGAGKGSGTGSGSGSGSGSGAGSGSASSVPFGEPVTKCKDPNAFALSFDDGPFQFTDTLLDLLKEKKLKATFFVNGENFGKISEMGDVLQRMLKEGHQIGSHTFDHKDLATLEENEVGEEMTKLDDELLKLIKMTPTYMRPPFFSTNEKSLAVLKQMQYHVINADIDTKDFENTTPETNDKAFENFKREFDNGGTISLMHDVHNTTVNQLMPNVVNFLASSNRKSLTVGECLGDAKENWYRAGNGRGGNSTAPPRKEGPKNKPKKSGNKGGSCGCGRKTGGSMNEGDSKKKEGNSKKESGMDGSETSTGEKVKKPDSRLKQVKEDIKDALLNKGESMDESSKKPMA